MHKKYVTLEKESSFGSSKIMVIFAVSKATEKEKTIKSAQQFSKKNSPYICCDFTCNYHVAYLLLALWFKKHGGYHSVVIASKNFKI